MFADDTKCLKQICSEKDESDLQADLDGTNEWSRLWKMFFNESKNIHLSFIKGSKYTPSPMEYTL